MSQLAGRKESGPSIKRRRVMYKEDIVFFDQLGFGWAIDKRIILKVFTRAQKQQKVNEKVLFSRASQAK